MAELTRAEPINVSVKTKLSLFLFGLMLGFYTPDWRIVIWKEGREGVSYIFLGDTQLMMMLFVCLDGGARRMLHHLSSLELFNPIKNIHFGKEFHQQNK